MQKENRKQTSIAGRLQHIKPERVHDASNQTSREPQHSACTIKKTKQRDSKSFQLAEKIKYLEHIPHSRDLTTSTDEVHKGT
jgi:hypothetical protein